MVRDIIDDDNDDKKIPFQPRKPDPDGLQHENILPFYCLLMLLLPFLKDISKWAGAERSGSMRAAKNKHENFLILMSFCHFRYLFLFDS